VKEEIGAYDAKTKLPEILRRVEEGESFTITNRGRPVADLVPSREGKERLIESAIRNLLAAKKPPVSDEELKELRETGRK
jgi:prevent-host-death family protein